MFLSPLFDYRRSAIIRCTTAANDSRLDELDIQRDGNLISNENAAGFKRGVPCQAEISAVNLRRCRQANAGIAPRIFGWRGGSFHSKHHIASDAMNRQVPRDGPLSGAGFLYAC